MISTPRAFVVPDGKTADEVLVQEWRAGRYELAGPSVASGPLRASAYVEPRRSLAMPTVIDATPTDVSGVWSPAAHVQEVGTPRDRAFATVIRSAPLLAIVIPLSIAAAWLTESGWALWLLMLAGLWLASYLAILWLDLVHNSPNATERHRVNAAYRLKALELRHNQELRRAVVEAYLDHLNAQEGR